MPDDTSSPDQFWLLTGEVPAGPFTLAQVHAELAAGRATWDTRVCRVGGSTWLPLVQMPGVGPAGPPAAADARAPDAAPVLPHLRPANRRRGVSKGCSGR